MIRVLVETSLEFDPETEELDERTREVLEDSCGDMDEGEARHEAICIIVSERLGPRVLDYDVTEIA